MESTGPLVEIQRKQKRLFSYLALPFASRGTVDKSLLCSSYLLSEGEIRGPNSWTVVRLR